MSTRKRGDTSPGGSRRIVRAPDGTAGFCGWFRPVWLINIHVIVVDLIIRQ